MSYRCEHCQSLFFKTLETRLLVENEAILYKKRCKRCKYKYFIRKTIGQNQMQSATYEEWTQGRKVVLPFKRVSERSRIFVSEYTGRISQAAETPLEYLNRVRNAEEGRHPHGQPKTSS
jgi:transcriptional regulator NrdR family protein